MIALVRGEVAVRRPGYVVVVCGGVGYKAFVSDQTLSHVPAVGKEVSLFTHLLLRDEGLNLYGFHCEEERDLFLQLLCVPAVGPKLALAILSLAPVRELTGAIAAGDARRFQAAPGVGRRTAERLVNELRERFASAPSNGQPAEVAAAGPLALARAGLIELGFSYSEAEGLLAAAKGETAEELIAQALRNARRRG
jgi:Holliday junction DNA helicase RuvA